MSTSMTEIPIRGIVIIDIADLSILILTFLQLSNKKYVTFMHILPLFLYPFITALGTIPSIHRFGIDL